MLCSLSTYIPHVAHVPVFTLPQDMNRASSWPLFCECEQALQYSCDGCARVWDFAGSWGAVGTVPSGALGEWALCCRVHSVLWHAQHITKGANCHGITQIVTSGYLMLWLGPRHCSLWKGSCILLSSSYQHFKKLHLDKLTLRWA